MSLQLTMDIDCFASPDDKLTNIIYNETLTNKTDLFIKKIQKIQKSHQVNLRTIIKKNHMVHWDINIHSICPYLSTIIYLKYSNLRHYVGNRNNLEIIEKYVKNIPIESIYEIYLDYISNCNSRYIYTGEFDEYLEVHHMYRYFNPHQDIFTNVPDYIVAKYMNRIIQYAGYRYKDSKLPVDIKKIPFGLIKEMMISTGSFGVTCSDYRRIVDLGWESHSLDSSSPTSSFMDYIYEYLDNYDDFNKNPENYYNNMCDEEYVTPVERYVRKLYEERSCGCDFSGQR